MALILIVDDEPDIRKLIAAFVTQEGHTALTAASTAEAMAELEKEPALVFLDVDMPGETGITLVIRLRVNRLHLETPIVFVTAYPERCVTLQKTGDANIEVIPKPFRKEHIVGAIQKYCPADVKS